MTETLLHDLFHAILPTLASHVDYVLAGVVIWFVRTKLQVSNAQIATLLAELEGIRAEKRGERISGEAKKALALDKAKQLNGPLVEPRSKRQDKLIESVRPGAG